MTKFLATLVLAAAAPVALAAGAKFPVEAANTNLGDRASLQRGAAMFMNYCASCHSAELIRFSRIARDIGLSEEQVMQNLNFVGAKFQDTVTVAMTPEDAKAWLGAPAPDLSLTARAKHQGADWIYTYLKSFYLDESRPAGWNNPLLPGASMPHVLWEYQGIQRVVTEPRPRDAQGREQACRHGEVANACFVRFETVSPGLMTEAEYSGLIRDISNFMEYIAEPAAMERRKYGVWVVLFLAFFTFLAWLLKKEYWRDVH
jgi:ubiquinol-cytochrome c reductase cytochrome c1 subunit